MFGGYFGRLRRGLTDRQNQVHRLRRIVDAVRKVVGKQCRDNQQMQCDNGRERT